MAKLPTIANDVPQVRAPQSRLSGAQIQAPYQDLKAALDKQGMSLDAAAAAIAKQAEAANTKARAMMTTAEASVTEGRAGMTVAAAEMTKAQADESLARSAVQTGQAEARASQAWASAYTHVGEVLMRDVAVPAATRAGEQAVTRDESGQVQVERLPLFGDAAVAYDRAMKIAALTDFENVARRADIDIRQQFPNDPQGYLKAANQFRDDQVKQYNKNVGQDVGVQVGRVADRLATESYRSIVSRKEGNDLLRASQIMDAEITQTQNEMVALANGGDTSSAEFVSRAAKMKALYDEKVDNPRLAYPRERAVFEQEQFFSQMRAAGIAYRIATEEYDKGGRAAAMTAAKSILTDPKLNLSPGQRESYYRAAEKAVNDRARADDVFDTAVRANIDDIERSAAEGHKPLPDRLATVRQAVASSNNPLIASRYEAVMRSLPIVASWWQMSPAQLDSDLAKLEAGIRINGPNQTSETLRKTGRELLKTMNKEIMTDPLGWAERVGVAAVPPIDFSKPEAVADMRARIASAEVVARQYGIAPTYLRPEERRAIEVATAQGGAPMMATARMIADGFGDRANSVYAEVSKQSPKLAHMGGLLNGGLFGGGSALFAADVAEGTKLLSTEESRKQLPHWARTPTDKVYQFHNTSKVDQYGGAFRLIENNERAAEESAKTAFMVRGIRNGYDPSSTLVSTTARAAYNRALQEAAGATYDAKNVQYGGVVDYGTKPGTWFSSNKVLIPSTIRSDRFKDVIGAIRDDDLKLMPVSPQTADGKVYTARDLQAAVPVAVPGGYRFAAGDPTSDDPKWINGADGNPFVLNLERLEPVLRQRKPEAFAGAR